MCSPGELAIVLQVNFLILRLPRQVVRGQVLRLPLQAVGGLILRLPPSRSCPSCRARQRRPAAKRQEDRRLKVKDVAASHFVLGSNSTSAHSGCPSLVSEGARQLRYQSRCVTGSNNPKAKDQAPRLFHVARLSNSGKVPRSYGVGCTSSTALLCKVG